MQLHLSWTNCSTMLRIKKYIELGGKCKKKQSAKALKVLYSDSSAGHHLQQKGLEETAVNWKIIDRLKNQIKLLTIKATNNRQREKPSLNTHGKFRSREFTLKIYRSVN